MWRDRQRKECTASRLSEVIYETLGYTEEEYQLYAAGLVSGKKILGSFADFGLYTLYLDVRVVIIFADQVHPNSSDKELYQACYPACFEKECEKPRVACAILWSSKEHYDMGVVCRPEVQAVFDVGPEWDDALALILNELRTLKKESRSKPPWIPPAHPVQLSVCVPHIPLLTTLRASFSRDGVAPKSSVAITPSPVPVHSTASTSTSALTPRPTSSTVTFSTTSVTTSVVARSASFLTTGQAPTTKTVSRWVVAPKNRHPVISTRMERWDLERVNWILDQLSGISPPHHDVRLLLQVKERVNKDGFLLVEYRHAQDASFGRVYSGVGFQSCTKETRSFCSAQFYVEDDLVNAFPTIMSQVFKQAGIKTPFLDEYVSRRESLFQEICTPSLSRECVKSLFLTSLHGGNYRHHEASSPGFGCSASVPLPPAFCLSASPPHSHSFSRYLNFWFRHSCNCIRVFFSFVYLSFHHHHCHYHHHPRHHRYHHYHHYYHHCQSLFFYHHHSTGRDFQR
jgi:hypothetical protein